MTPERRLPFQSASCWTAGLSMPRYYGDCATVLHAFQVGTGPAAHRAARGYALRLDATVLKRLGWVRERQGIDSPAMDQIAEHSVKGYRQLDPTDRARGPGWSRRTCPRWSIYEDMRPRKLVDVSGPTGAGHLGRKDGKAYMSP